MKIPNPKGFKVQVRLKSCSNFKWLIANGQIQPSGGVIKQTGAGLGNPEWQREYKWNHWFKSYINFAKWWNFAYL